MQNKWLTCKLIKNKNTARKTRKKGKNRDKNILSERTNRIHCPNRKTPLAEKVNRLQTEMKSKLKPWRSYFGKMCVSVCFVRATLPALIWQAVLSAPRSSVLSYNATYVSMHFLCVPVLCLFCTMWLLSDCLKASVQNTRWVQVGPGGSPQLTYETHWKPQSQI